MDNKREFNRNVCFNFFESYLEQGEMIREQLGDEKGVEYFIALAKYALYQEESEDAMIRMFITGLKNTIDAGQSKRERGYKGKHNSEDVELTKKIIEYKKEHPDESQDKIAKACNCSKGKVNKVIKRMNEEVDSLNNNVNDNSNLNSNSNLNDNLNLNSNTNSMTVTVTEESQNTQSREEEKEEKDLNNKRRLEDLTDEELDNLEYDYKLKVKYTELYKKYNLTERIDNTLLSKIFEIKKDREREYRKQEANERLLNNDDNFYVNTNKAEYVKKTEECLPELESLWYM